MDGFHCQCMLLLYGPLNLYLCVHWILLLFKTFQYVFSHPFMPLSVDPHHSNKISWFLFIFKHFPTCTLLLIIFTHASFIFISPLHLPRYSPYRLHSNSTCASVLTCPSSDQSPSYFHASFRSLLAVDIPLSPSLLL